MIDTTEEVLKTCIRCSLPKPLSEFYAHGTNKDRKQGKCKACFHAYFKANQDKLALQQRERQQKPEYKVRNVGYQRKYYVKNVNTILEKHRDHAHTETGRASNRERKKQERIRDAEKVKVRQMTADAIRRGELIRQPCEKCGELKVEAHHSDYSKPFEIMWLCRLHHDMEHGKLSYLQAKN